MVIIMGIGRKVVTGFVLIIALNYFMDFIVSNIQVSVKILWWDISGIIKAIVITILNLIAFIGLRGMMGVQGAVTT